MLHRISRGPVWSLTSIVLVLVALSQGFVQHPSIGRTTALWSALALTGLVCAWRILHHELQRRMASDAQLRERMQRLEDAIQHNVDGMLLLRAVRTPDGALSDLEITDINASAASICRRTPDALTGKRLRRDLQIPNGELLYARYAAVVNTQTPLVEDLRADRRYVTAAWLRHQVIPTCDGIAVTIRDITASKREERRLRKASLTDDLTRLSNRRGFMALAEQQLRVARRQGKDAVVVYADMDGFKQLNDMYGHGVGDRALQAVARVLRSTVRDSDVVARLGGDEFTILALDADGAGARSIQKRIEERLALLNAGGELPVSIALTIGYTRVAPSDGASVVELLARADTQLYERKRRRRIVRVPARVAAEAEALVAALPIVAHASQPAVPSVIPSVVSSGIPDGVRSNGPRSHGGRTGTRRGRQRIATVPPEVAAVATAMATARGLLPANAPAAARATAPAAAGVAATVGTPVATPVAAPVATPVAAPVAAPLAVPAVPSALAPPTSNLQVPVPPTHAA